MYTALTVIAKYITDIVRCSCDSNLTEMNSLVYEYFVKRFLGSLVTNSTISYNSHKVYCKQIHTHPFNGPFSGTTQVGWYQKGKTNLDFTEARDSEWHWILLKQETVSGIVINWAICKSAPCSRQTTTPAPHHSVFTGRMPFLPPNQQRQSTEVL